MPRSPRCDASGPAPIPRSAPSAADDGGMYEGFSDRAQRVVTAAQEQARLLGHGHVGTEHLLLAVLVDGSTAASRVLVAAGATADGARRKVMEAVPANGQGADLDHLPLTARAQRALDRAGRFARQRHDPEVSTGHVLLGILDVEGTAGQGLRGLGVDVPALPAALEAPARSRGATPAVAPAAPSPPPADEPATEPAPCCSGCGAELAGALAYRTIAASGAEGQRRVT